jgi:hypothetical protein
MGDLLMIRAEACANPTVFLEAVMSGPTVNPLLRVQAAGMLLKSPKHNVRYLSRSIDIPPPTSVAEAQDQMQQVIGLERLRYIGVDEAREQIERLGAYIASQQSIDHEARIAALEQANRERGPPAPIIEVTGMPAMPGTENVRMPECATPAEPPSDPNPWAKS